jgi:hypothetical protein
METKDLYEVTFEDRIAYAGPDELMARRCYDQSCARSAARIEPEAGCAISLFRNGRLLIDYPGHESAQLMMPSSSDPVLPQRTPTLRLRGRLGLFRDVVAHVRLRLGF